MMLEIGILGVIGTLLAIEFQKSNKEYGILLGLAIAIFIFICLLSQMEIIVETANRIQSLMTIDIQYIEVILKMLGITYIAEFTSGVCKDAGYGNISTQIELYGKIAILALSMPILLALLEAIEMFMH